MLDRLWGWLGKCTQTTESLDLICLKVEFDQLPKHERIEVVKEFREAVSMLDDPAVWTVGSLVFGQPLGDDSFKDFRRWLILQGREVAIQAISAPDGLASTFNLKAGDDRIFLESVAWLETLTSEVASRSGHSTAAWTTPDLCQMQTLAPQTFAAFSTSFRTDHLDVADIIHFSIEGLGILKVGDRIRHLGAFGIGVIRAIHIAETGAQILNFQMIYERCGYRHRFSTGQMSSR